MLQEDPPQSRSSCPELLQRVSSHLELSLLCERPYITYTLAVTLFNFGYFVPYFHLVAHSRQAGFSEYQAAFVMSAAGATDILGRVVSGWFSDLGHFRTVHLLTLWTVLAGAFIMLLPVGSLTGSYAALVVSSLLYGFSSGALTSLVFAVVPMIVGVQRVMGGLGLLQLIESSAGLLGTPLSGQLVNLKVCDPLLCFLTVFTSVFKGWLRDVTGNYLASFMVAGSFLLLGSLTLATLPHYFSCTDPTPPHPHRHSSRSSHQQLERSDEGPH